MFDRFNMLFGRTYLAVTSRKYSLRRQEGQTMAEYALILGIIAVASVTVLGLLSTEVKNKFTAICVALKPGANPTCP